MKAITTTLTYKKVTNDMSAIPYFVQSIRYDRHYTPHTIGEEIKEYVATLSTNKGTLDVTVIFEEVMGE